MAEATEAWLGLWLDSSWPEWRVQREIVRYAEQQGWKVHYTPISFRRGMLRTQQGGDNGFPDLVLARAGVVLFAEIKSARGRLTEDQVKWQNALPQMYVWRASDRTEIEAILY